MDTSRPSVTRIAAAWLAGAGLLGPSAAALAGPPTAISVQVATPGLYTSFSTGPQWAPYHVHPVVPVVPVYAAPVYVPRYYTWGPPPGYWRSRHVDYRHSGWDRGWRDDDDHHHHYDRPRHHRHDDRRGGRGHGDRH